MGKALVIVESPAKAKTINKYLGSGYVVKSSVGHIRDLPKSGSGSQKSTGSSTDKTKKVKRSSSRACEAYGGRSLPWLESKLSDLTG